MDNLKTNEGKALWCLLPMKQVEEVVKVFTYGAYKYAPNNWKNEKDPFTKDFSAALRHLAAYQNGEVTDESGFPHLAHAIADLLIVMYHEMEVDNDF